MIPRRVSHAGKVWSYRGLISQTSAIPPDQQIPPQQGKRILLQAILRGWTAASCVEAIWLATVRLVYDFKRDSDYGSVCHHDIKDCKMHSETMIQDRDLNSSKCWRNSGTVISMVSDSTQGLIGTLRSWPDASPQRRSDERDW